ncbi:hypothetical protein [Pantoea vagans]|nr:hypothetical protein [Pantoea vagans]MDE8559329.1 hypothetical protein [Pantoea vagans]MDE8579329.1 hypothetical protein [Pantoea vagans]
MAINELEPTYLIDKKEHAAIEGKILRNQLTPKDELLSTWINLHN